MPHTSPAGSPSSTAQQETRTCGNTATTDTDANFNFITEYTFRENICTTRVYKTAFEQVYTISSQYLSVSAAQSPEKETGEGDDDTFLKYDFPNL